MIYDGDVYKNTIIGPFGALLDSTIPWEGLIYSSEEINPIFGTLVDLDNDGKLELYNARDNRLYALSSSPELIRDNLVENLSDSDRDFAVAFLDMDGDGDLDLFINYSKGYMSMYHENTGTAEVPRFDTEGVDAQSIWEVRKDRLPPGFYEQGLNQAPYLISADIDQDGDLDLISASIAY